ncbi:MAG: M23 family metallopeptidase [Candidatus Obscuribacterales bacterium]|nr:M23 family metallopeptidase [Candidatus Obscuribacterales bacterium]
MKLNRIQLILLFVCLKLSVVEVSAASVPEDSALQVGVQEKQAQVVVFAQSNANILEATVSVNAQLTNMSSSLPLPAVGTVSGANLYAPIVYLEPVDSRQPWNYNYQFVWHKGLPSSLELEPWIYQFPFAAGGQFSVSQGAGGRDSHQYGGENENAIDFAMPEGTTVCAARSGLVIAIKGDSDLGGPDSKYEQCANYVVVKHNDGTYANYMHLKRNGLLVKLGQVVQAGESLALSGNTGYSTEPHLHFDVYRLTASNERKTVPLRFQTRGGPVEALKGQFYWRDSSQ